MNNHSESDDYKFDTLCDAAHQKGGLCSWSKLLVSYYNLMYYSFFFSGYNDTS